MNLFGKILVLIAVIVAIIASFVKFPYSSLIMVILGLLVGLVSAKIKELQHCVVAGLGLALGNTVLGYFSVISVVFSDFLKALFGNILTIVSSVILALVLKYLISYVFKK